MKNIFATLSGIAAGGILAALGVSIGYSAQNPDDANEMMRINSMMPAQLPKATTTPLPQATKTITITPKAIVKVEKKYIVKKVQSTTLTCAWGKTEDSCYPDYIGGGKWVLRKGERPAASAIPGVCRHPSITKGMLNDCIKKANRKAVYVAGKYGHPAGQVLVKECTDQYKGKELAICLMP